jgi:hypothetical protein
METSLIGRLTWSNRSNTTRRTKSAHLELEILLYTQWDTFCKQLSILWSRNILWINDAQLIKNCYFLTFQFSKLPVMNCTQLDWLDARKHNLITECLFITDYYVKYATNSVCRPTACYQNFQYCSI